MLRFGIVGTNFVSDWFVHACTKTGGRAVPIAVYSRTEERGEAFAWKHGLPVTTSDFEAMLAAVDAVYIASPTSAHFPQAMAAIAAGRPVLVEKTMTANLAEAEALFAAAEKRDVVAMEATRSLHTPAHRLVRESLNLLGPLRYAHLEMLQYSSRYGRHLAGEQVNVFDPALGNAAVVDIGVYCLEPALDWFGVPRSTTGRSVRLSNGFEALGDILLDYESMVADLTYSKVAQSVTPSVITGEGGSLTINSIGEPSRIVLHERGGEPRVLLEQDPWPPAEGMHWEILSFADQVARGATDPRWRDVTLAARRIMDEQLAR